MKEQLQKLLDELKYDKEHNTHPTSLMYVSLTKIIYRIEKILRENEH